MRSVATRLTCQNDPHIPSATAEPQHTNGQKSQPPTQPPTHRATWLPTNKIGMVLPCTTPKKGTCPITSDLSPLCTPKKRHFIPPVCAVYPSAASRLVTCASCRWPPPRCSRRCPLRHCPWPCRCPRGSGCFWVSPSAIRPTPHSRGAPPCRPPAP